MAVALAASGTVEFAILLGGVALLANARHHGREFSYRFLFALSGVAFLAFLAGGLIDHWPDVKQGFMGGYPVGRSLL